MFLNTLIFSCVAIGVSQCWVFTEINAGYNPKTGTLEKMSDTELRSRKFGGSVNPRINEVDSTANEIDGNVLDELVYVGEDGDVPQERLNLIFPGTRWCGAGNTASDYDDLGPAAATDRCCRDHDYCPDVIHGGNTAHNLTNNSFYSRLSCACDEQFRNCLRNSNSGVSNKVGLMYFDLIGTQCFREDYPVVSCLKYGGYFKTKCVEYEYDTTGRKEFQWFDVPSYN